MRQRSDIPYRRLPGRARKRFGVFTRQRQELWLASDHLLLVEHNGFTERYKRFYLRDIRLLVMCRTPAGRIMNGVLALLLTLCILYFLGLPPDFVGNPEWTILAGILGAVAVASIVVLPLNIIFGPTCACQIHTAVHAERLYALGRVRTAGRVISLLRERIEAVQGRFVSSAEAGEVQRVDEETPPSVEPSDQQKQAEDKEGNAEDRAD